MARRQFRPIPELTQKDIDRFWSKVDKRGPDECWPWKPAIKTGDHGMFGIRSDVYCAHRVALFVGTGKDPLEKDSCHTCDYPPCCNPNHLFAGFAKDNIDDMIRKGRKVQVTGESHPRARLTWEQVQDIRKRYRKGRQTKENRHLGSFALAKEFDITVTQLLTIARGDQWKAQSHLSAENS